MNPPAHSGGAGSGCQKAFIRLLGAEHAAHCTLIAMWRKSIWSACKPNSVRMSNTVYTRVFYAHLNLWWSGKWWRIVVVRSEEIDCSISAVLLAILEHLRKRMACNQTALNWYPKLLNILSKYGGGSKVHVGSLEDAPFEKGEFQYITAFETLEHLRDPIKVLYQMKELLSDDGILAISVPSADYFRFKFWFYRKQPL